MSNEMNDLQKFDGKFLKSFISDAIIYAKAIDPLISISTSSTNLCQICNKTIEEGAMMRNMKCAHLFHEECIVKHYDTVAEECPLCHKDTLIQIEFPEED